MSVSEQLEQFVKLNGEAGYGTVPTWLAELWLSEVKDLESRTVGGMIAEGLEELVEDAEEGRLLGWCVRVIDTSGVISPLFVSEGRPLGHSGVWEQRMVYTNEMEAKCVANKYNNGYEERRMRAEAIPNGTELFCLTAKPVTE